MKEKEANLLKLQGLGYSKTKATAALKDAGGNYHLAEKILKNLAQQQQQQEQKTKPKRAVSAEAPSASRAESPPAAKQRRHPCLVQYKKCQYGPFCALREYPGDTCINYFNGTCIHGSFCTKLHYVDGVDIRSGRREFVDDSTMTIPSGEVIALSSSCGGHVYTGKVIQPAPEKKIVCDAPPAPSNFNLILGSEPSHTDAPVPTTEAVSFPTNAPRPFLDAVRRAPNVQKGEQADKCSIIRVRERTNKESEQVVHAAGKRKKHPCVVQFNSCRYGDECMYADYDGDLCVFNLKNRCNRGEKCPYRHEANVTAQRSAPPEESGLSADSFSSAHYENTDAHVSATPTCENPTSCADVLSEFEEPQRKPILLSNLLPDEWAEKSVEAESDTMCNGDCDDAELTALIHLSSAFPQVDLQLLLQTLRAADGNADAAADALSRLDAFDSVDEMNAFLWSERVEEEEDTRERVLRSRQESLLTLCMLFADIDVPVIEATLEKCGGDCADAYGVLLCSQEKIPQTNYGQTWSGVLKASDENRVTQLAAMFPQFPRDLLRNTFGAAQSNFTRAVEALNALVCELSPCAESAQLQKKPRDLSTPAPNHHHPNKTTTTTSAPVPPHLQQQTWTSKELRQFRREVDAEVHKAGDWRLVREKAYFVNACRLRVLSQAAAAYLRNDGKTAKTLSRTGKALGAEYERLNRIAMIALEQERLKTGQMSTLDLHGFHVSEAIEVLRRRVQLCVKKNIQRLKIVVGLGLHNVRGRSELRPKVLEQLNCDPQLKGTVVLISVKPAYFVVQIKKNEA